MYMNKRKGERVQLTREIKTFRSRSRIKFVKIIRNEIHKDKSKTSISIRIITQFEILKSVLFKN